jgi:hypothetical protein
MFHVVIFRNEYKSQRFNKKLFRKIFGSKMDEWSVKDSDFDTLKSLDQI